jgi:predicted AAA+ superfamily ATPase
MTDINDIIELHNLALEGNKKYVKKRLISERLRKDTGKHFLGITGARGVGKSVLFKQMASETENAIYISLDSVDFENLFETVKELNRDYRYNVFFLDEIHFYKNYERDLKRIFDFLDVKIFFTSSVSLSLVSSAYDLSRRVKIYNMFPFGYREYLWMKEDKLLPKLTLSKIRRKEFSAEHLRAGHLFKRYIKGEIMPFALEEMDVLRMCRNILDKIIYRDIPSVADLKLNELELIRKVLAFIGKSQIDGISYSTLSNNLKITKYKAEQYVKLLESAFVLNVILPEGSNVLKEPKILMNLPFRLLYREFDEALGGLREDFFVETMKMSGVETNYLKSKKGRKTPDYLVKTGTRKYIVEVGGKGKGVQQFKGINLDKSIILTDNGDMRGIKRPLFLVGFLS